MVGVGQRIGNYRVLRKLGQGGMGAVYEAVQEEIGRRAAIKVLLPDFAKDQQSILRFFNEARAVNIIHHPGLVGVFESGRLDDGAAYIVMEYLSGELLTARLEKAGQLAHPDAINISRQIASALRAAHEKGIVHRDLKPDNVMLVADPEMPDGERVKIFDFGIAKLR
ncbi:MAG TPA: serine/threonine-protein kinase, partial [Pseudomonadota bacterium]|nr:serine/threonine-protein kinase [Pseudomonadota bacterium]